MHTYRKRNHGKQIWQLHFNVPENITAEVTSPSIPCTVKNPSHLIPPMLFFHLSHKSHFVMRIRILTAVQAKAKSEIFHLAICCVAYFSMYSKTCTKNLSILLANLYMYVFYVRTSDVDVESWKTSGKSVLRHSRKIRKSYMKAGLEHGGNERTNENGKKLQK